MKVIQRRAGSLGGIMGREKINFPQALKIVNVAQRYSISKVQYIYII